ncbi:hypothetical protein [Nocardiopsis sp. CNR-923]|uniref:hypothetical protein n=1 Tax=Nocardiopsis sp. CNR-923 TaxID=1904965 RepID=UPI0013011CAD|nr:hypothetical protein [Nocardiopsis sp. CNR-923]
MDAEVYGYLDGLIGRNPQSPGVISTAMQNAEADPRWRRSMRAERPAWVRPCR